ncbi:hypothetical protein [Nostocoides sp. F2B08]|uniref:hypothetical protein n=1 Tax=Nostocoides sp. F2B08 TaxID=2653936 RepID=UPI001D055D76|nr:hypothetical protein [Tetrasphaera sp. F2B08]
MRFSVLGMVVRDHQPDRDQQEWVSGPGGATPALELPYWPTPEALTWSDEVSYAGEGSISSPVSREVDPCAQQDRQAVLDAGLRLELHIEHASVPWDALPGLMVQDERREFRLARQPEWLPASFTLMTPQPAAGRSR